jgi:hypothetical protein
MSPPRYIMCKKLIRTAAEAEAEKAASILVEVSTKASVSRSGAAVATVTVPITTKMPEITAKDEPLAAAAAAAASSGKIRALCAAAKLVHSTLHFVSLRVPHKEVKGGLRQGDALIEKLLSQPESFGVAPQPEAVAAPAAPESGCSAYKYRHSWRRRRHVPVVVAASDDAPCTEEKTRVENVSEPAAGDVPPCYVYKYRHSWRRRKVPVVIAGGDGAPVTDEARGAVRSTGRRRAARVSVVVAGTKIGICEAAFVPDDSVDDDDDDDHIGGDVPPPVEVDFSASVSAEHVEGAISSSPGVVAAAHEEVAVVESIREGWQDRQQRRGRGARYAAYLAALRPSRRA